MRAITQNAFGGPEVLELVDIDVPRPIPTEVLVRVHAAGINPIEASIRSGAFPLLGEPPFVLGWDISGVVEHSTPDTWRFQPGDEVYGMPFFPRAANGYAEYVAAPARQLARKPASLDHAHAAALALVGLSAWQGIVDLAAVEAGHAALEQLAALVDAGDLHVHFERAFPLEQAAEAHRLVESGHVAG